MEIGLNKIFLFPDKLKQLLPLPGSDTLIDNTYPLNVELSLTNRCNSDCVWCSDRGIREAFGGDLEVEIVKNLIDDLAAGGCKGIVIEGGGEPTVYSQFEEVVRHIGESGMKLGLLTNGSIFNYESVLHYFEFVRVSLDAATNEQMRALKRSDNFTLDSILDNLARMVAARKTEDTVIGVGYVLSNQNIENLEGVIEKLKNIGVDYIYIRPVIDHPELEAKDFDPKKYEKLSTSRFAVMIRGMKENMITGNDHKPCNAHSVTSVVTADGNVYICGRLNTHKDWLPIGNLYHNSYREIWLGEERKRQALLLKSGDFCAGKCPSCRITKFNRMLSDLHSVKTKNFI